MTPQTRRQLATLVVLGVVLAAVLQWQLGGDDPADSTPAASNPAAPGVTGRRPAAGSVADVHLEALNAPREDVDRSDRNPFRFRPRPAPVAAQPQPRPTLVAPPVPAGPPPPPPIPLKFVGLLEAPRIGRVASLRDGRGNLFQGREGDIIEGRYQVLRIGDDSVELAYADGRGRQTIRLSGQ